MDVSTKYTKNMNWCLISKQRKKLIGTQPTICMQRRYEVLTVFLAFFLPLCSVKIVHDFTNWMIEILFECSAIIPNPQEAHCKPFAKIAKQNTVFDITTLIIIDWKQNLILQIGDEKQIRTKNQERAWLIIVIIIYLLCFGLNKSFSHSNSQNIHHLTIKCI